MAANNLHPDLIVPIAQRVTSFHDFLSLGAVCKSWSSAATKENFSRAHQVPWLMLPEREDTPLREFYDLRKDKTFKLDLPQTKEKLCYSSLGWLMTMTRSDKNSEVNLLHPLNQQVIQLPNVYNFKHHHNAEEDLIILFGDFLIRKFVLSSSPSFSSDYTLLIHSWERLAFWRPGDQDWTILDAHDERYLYTIYSDITYYKGEFYVAEDDGIVSVCEIGDPNKQPKTRIVVPEMPRELIPSHDQLYLVESAGALLLVFRLLTRTVFKVFEVPLTDGRWSFASEVQSLGNRTLFVGYNSSFSVNAFDYHGCKRNCIYFTDQPLACSAVNNMGIFHMEDDRIEPIMNELPELDPTPLLWIEPSF